MRMMICQWLLMAFVLGTLWDPTFRIFQTEPHHFWMAVLPRGSTGSKLHSLLQVAPDVLRTSGHELEEKKNTTCQQCECVMELLTWIQHDQHANDIPAKPVDFHHTRVVSSRAYRHFWTPLHSLLLLKSCFVALCWQNPSFWSNPIYPISIPLWVGWIVLNRWIPLFGLQNLALPVFAVLIGRDSLHQLLCQLLPSRHRPPENDGSPTCYRLQGLFFMASWPVPQNKSRNEKKLEP